MSVKKNTGHHNKKARGVPNMSLAKHRKFSGHNPKSPKLRHAIKREAEANERKDTSGIKNPKKSVKELFEGN